MGKAPCCDKANVKRGPWSPEEDQILKDYITRHGTGSSWISLPHKAGLKRCGKSCRLRWLNYLRPDIKHGDFSNDENRIIYKLFTTIGSRWSVMAAHLPGRTDNDIKNYWNTKLKKKLFGQLQPLARRGKQQKPGSMMQQLKHDRQLSFPSPIFSSHHNTPTNFPISPLFPAKPIETCLNPIQPYDHFHSTFSDSNAPVTDKHNSQFLIFGGHELSCSSSEMSWGNWPPEYETCRGGDCFDSILLAGGVFEDRQTGMQKMILGGNDQNERNISLTVQLGYDSEDNMLDHPEQRNDHRISKLTKGDSECNFSFSNLDGLSFESIHNQERFVS